MRATVDRVCMNCGLALAKLADLPAHQRTRTCKVATRRRHLVALGLVHVDGKALAGLQGAGFSLGWEDTSPAPVGGSYAPEAWAPGWAAILASGDVGLDPLVLAALLRHGLADATFPPAVLAAFRLGGAEGVRALTGGA